ncbi:MAG: ABC transporter permease [Nitrospirae bacterium]|nr:ABC transporter permease [Nitrospirota bacterium]
MRLHRINAIVLRHLYLHKRSVARLMETFYWPVVDLLVWGFITVYLQQYKDGLPGFVTFFIGALILWDMLFRSQQGISLSFLEEMWSRNLMNLFVTPLRPAEFIAATMVISIFKLISASFVTITLAYLIYDFNIFLIGMSLIPFIICLAVMGWAIGILTSSVILRYGQKAEILAWGLAFLFQPISAVFYPVEVLPDFIQKIAKFVPASHIFEGMRAVIADGHFPLENLIWAASLDIIYFITSIAIFYYMFKIVKVKGLLLRIGE